MREYDNINSVKKVLIVNTCGWVDGLGADIQMNIVDKVRPSIVVTMRKFSQGSKDTNEFSKRCKGEYPQYDYIDVFNDPFEGSINVKGAV
jgi:polynucleotide 5'-kinase involved in rRNA processing